MTLECATRQTMAPHLSHSIAKIRIGRNDCATFGGRHILVAIEA
jgi:hypothetical protein